MKDKILNLIETSNYTEAANLLISEVQQNGLNDDYAVLGATICGALNDNNSELLYIQEGLRYNPNNYELLMMLGNHYLTENSNLAYLCYENALHHAIVSGHSDDAEVIKNHLDYCKTDFHPTLRNVSIVILSFNTLEMTKDCINSIRKNCAKGSYELIIVDNASTDGSLDWLKAQDDIVLIANEKNEGFPRGCNIGIEASSPDNDILLLNSDTIVPENALFTLRVGLYSSETIGTAGSVCNEAINGQDIEEQFDTIEEYLINASNINLPSDSAIECKSWLLGYCMLIKRDVLEETGYLDEIFTPGNFEDNDLSLRINLAGYQNVICHNSFIFHYGHGSFNNDYNPDSYNALIIKNRKKFMDKWQGVEPEKFGYIMPGIESAIKHSQEDNINILEIGCYGGNDLSRLKYFFPKANVYGTEKNKLLSDSASVMIPCVNIDAEKEELPFDKNYFDYIFFNEYYEKFNDADSLIEKCKPYLRMGGFIIRLLTPSN